MQDAKSLMQDGVTGAGTSAASDCADPTVLAELLGM